MADSPKEIHVTRTGLRRPLDPMRKESSFTLATFYTNSKGIQPLGECAGPPHEGVKRCQKFPAGEQSQLPKLCCLVKFRNPVHLNQCHLWLVALPGCVPTQNDSCLPVGAAASAPCELLLCLGSRGAKSKGKGKKKS